MKDERKDMFARYEDDGYVTALPGIQRKTLVYGEKTLMVEFRLAKGASLPSHSHPYEQTGYLVSGRMTLTVGDEAIEVFSPLREDYLPPAAT